MTFCVFFVVIRLILWLVFIVVHCSAPSVFDLFDMSCYALQIPPYFLSPTLCCVGLHFLLTCHFHLQSIFFHTWFVYFVAFRCCCCCCWDNCFIFFLSIDCSIERMMLFAFVCICHHSIRILFCYWILFANLLWCSWRVCSHNFPCAFFPDECL